jgi:hypothetical protein
MRRHSAPASVLVFAASFLFSTPLFGVSVVFNDFSSTAGLVLNGNTAVATTADGKVLRLVPDLPGKAGSAFSSTQINASTFSTFFQFRITHSLGCVADGFVFVIQPVSSGVGGGGGGEGYLGITPSVGVEFDDFFNGGLDPNGNHIGVLSNGNLSPYLGPGPVTPPTTLSNGDLWSAWIDYNGTNLEVRVADGSSTRPTNAILTVPINVAATLGQNAAFVGFTAGTGACQANHDIIQWQYNDTFSPIGATVPAPSSIVLLAIGLIGITAFQARRRILAMFRG